MELKRSLSGVLNTAGYEHKALHIRLLEIRDKDPDSDTFLFQETTKLAIYFEQNQTMQNF